MRKYKNPLKNYRNTQTGEGTEENHSGSKTGNRNNEEITKGDNSGYIKPWKEIRSHRYKH